MKFKTRRKWENDARNQQVHPLRLYKPSTLADLVAIVQEAERLRVKVRAVGSGHSSSDAALSPDFMVLPNDLSRVLFLDRDVLKTETSDRALVELESGVTIRKLNEHLDDLRLALPNMGGYDGQTIVGATATSTHGSGLTFGPLTEMIQSFDVVTSRARILRVERSNGVTDSTKYRQKFGTTRALIQDDDAFHALGVGLGCMGLIYSLIIEVVPSFWLKEVRTMSTWEAVQAELLTRHVFEDNEHYELLLNPYAVDGGHACLVTTRNPTDPPSHLPPDQTNRNFITELLSSMSVTSWVLKTLFNTQPETTPELISQSLHGLEDTGYTNKSFKVFNIGAANDLAAVSAEYGFSMEGNLYIAAVDALLNVAEVARRAGDAFQTGPISVRFVRGTEFFLSPQFGRNTAMIEIVAVSGTTSALEMLYRYEETAYALNGRPHWGQVNHVAGIELMARLFPAVGRWRDIRDAIFDPERTFDGPVTRRLGL